MSRYRYRSKKGNHLPPLFLLITMLVILALVIISKIGEFLSDNEWFSVFLIISAVSVLIVAVAVKIIKDKYTELATHQSPAILTLKKLNSQYRFEQIACSDMHQNYDNENFYNDISPIDYLTYQLVYMQKQD